MACPRTCSRWSSAQAPVRPYRFKEGDPARVWQELEAPDAVLVSEPFSLPPRAWTVGGTVGCPRTRAPRHFRVVGVYFDYGSDTGTVLMPRGT